MIALETLRELASTPYADRAERPIWLQIYDRIGAAVTTGLLPEGTRLPGEDDMAVLFGVSRATLRRALRRHQQEGHLVARKGVGIFVRSLSVRYIVHQNRAFNDPINSESIVEETLSIGRIPASAEAAETFGLCPGDEVIELRLRMLLGNMPIYFTIKEFPISVFPDFESDYAETGSILGAYAAGGVENYRRTETRIIGDMASATEADLLQLSPAVPILRARSTNTDLSGRIIELSRGCWPLFGVELVFEAEQAG
ncbi:GntR family transcriptional regulator [Pseudodonghicola sp.]|uniref:GntR family transcriptional regulator n=1 Tax=Pseudodonghicola sp. TaxID=1969463 RepID=UPI003A97A9EC